MDKLGLGYKTLSEINPGLIYAVISGYGLTGPYLQRPAFDLIGQAVAGIMDAQGNPDRPPGVMFADLVSGAYCALGALIALIQRGKTGKGQIVDISMQEVMYSHHFQQLSDRALLPVKEMMDSFIGRSVIEMLTDWADPMFFWNSYRTKDGYVAIVALTERQWANLIKAAGKPELATDERFSNIVGRIKNNHDVRGIVEEWTSSKTTAEIVEELNANRVPCGAVAKRSELTTDHQLRDRGVFKNVNHPRFGSIEINANPIRLSGYPEPEYSAAPDIGANTIDVLARIAGLSQKELESLSSEGVIFTQT